MDGKNTFDTLQFNDYSSLDNKVKAIPTIECNAFVDYGNSQLPLKPDSAKV